MNRFACKYFNKNSSHSIYIFVQIINRSFAHCLYDSKIMRFTQVISFAKSKMIPGTGSARVRQRTTNLSIIFS